MPQVIEIPMCRLCHVPRMRCQCIAGRRGGRIVDSYHKSLDVAAEYILTERFFGREKLETALEMLAHVRTTIRTLVASSSLDGRELMQVDKDVERLTRKAKGRFFATVTKMAEMKDDNKRKGIQSASDTPKSVADMLEAHRNRLQHMTMR
jgi:hypothetical protein